MVTVAIVEYGMSNIDSVARAVEYCGGRPFVTSDPSVLATASHLILPGVGSFDKGMENLRKRGLVDVLNEQVIGNRIPFLGICLGMHFLATRGHEGQESQGLGWIDGDVVRLQSRDESEKIPHVGWNRIDRVGPNALLDKIESGKDFYFVHSYHLSCSNPDQVLALTPYCGSFASVVGRDNIFGVQFHPEKSQKGGFQLLRNFLSI